LTDSGDGQYEVVWPKSERMTALQPLAPRLASLEGAKVAQLWDYLFRGDEVFDVLEEGLKARYPTSQFVSWREFGNVHGEDELQVLAELPGRLKAMGVDAVICGMAC
jgi:hypothetical protein